METITARTSPATSSMEFGDIKVTAHPRAEEGNMKAIASMTYAGMRLTSMRILDSKNGLFVSPPSEKRNDKWHSWFFFTDRELREKVNKAVISEYQRLVNQTPAASSPPADTPTLPAVGTATAAVAETVEGMEDIPF